MTYIHSIPPNQLIHIQRLREREKVKRGQVVWKGKKFTELSEEEKKEYMENYHLI